MARNYLVFFFILILVFAFTLVFCWQAIQEKNTLYGILAILGFLTGIVSSLVIGFQAREEGGSLFVWFLAYTIFISIFFIWYLTRGGSLFQFWVP
jgi:hypothetical protein